MPSSASSSRRPLVWVAQAWWMEGIYEGVAEVAAEKGWRLDSQMRWHRGDPIPVPPRADGVIVFTGHCLPLVDKVKALGAPIVDIETYADHYGAPKVLTYDTAIGELAAFHLSAGLPRSLLFVRFGNRGSPVLEGRVEGFRTGAAKVGLAMREIEAVDFDPRALAKQGPVGVFAGGDSSGAELATRCIEAGVRVPEDIAIVGADDDRILCESSPVPLSSVNMGFKHKGRVAAELLARLMRGEAPPKKPVQVPLAGVTCRKSTRCVETGHPDLDRLIRHFRENAWRPVGVETLCEECGVPPRTAAHLLRTRLGSSSLSLLRSCRLTLAERFAASGKLTREAVAKASGFAGPAALLRAEKSEDPD